MDVAGSHRFRTNYVQHLIEPDACAFMRLH